MSPIIQIADKAIAVTGAGSGIGRETAIVLSQHGAKVVLIDIDQIGLETTLSYMSSGKHVVMPCDLADFGQLPMVVKEINSRIGPLNGLVHCAGISSRKPLNVLKAQNFSKIMDVNFYSFVELTRLFTKKGFFENGGSIVVMSSISSKKGYKAKTEYCVSKAAVDAFVRCSALELADKQIRVNSVMPGEVNTPLGVKAREMAKAMGTKEHLQPLGITEPREIANLITFLLSDATRTITGTSIIIDGGATI